MAPAHLKPLTLLSATLPIFHTMTLFPHTLKQLSLCNSLTQPLGSATSKTLLQNPPLLLHRMSKPGYSQAPLDCTPRIFPTSPPSLKAISLVTSAWINSSPSCPHILLILRPCRPPSSNFEHLSALKLRLHRKLEIAFVRSTLMRLSVFGLRSLKMLLLPHVSMLKDIQLVSLQNFCSV